MFSGILKCLVLAAFTSNLALLYGPRTSLAHYCRSLGPLFCAAISPLKEEGSSPVELLASLSGLSGCQVVYRHCPCFSLGLFKIFRRPPITLPPHTRGFALRIVTSKCSTVQTELEKQFLSTGNCFSSRDSISMYSVDSILIISFAPHRKSVKRFIKWKLCTTPPGQNKLSVLTYISKVNPD